MLIITSTRHGLCPLSMAEALRLSLGAPLASDIMRTIELERLGFAVAWTAIPPSISPMNRILLAHRPEREVGA
jgi:hypothetical protein